MTPKQISEHIFYSPATNGKAESSIADGAALIDAHVEELNLALEYWKEQSRVRLLIIEKQEKALEIALDMVQKIRKIGRNYYDT